MARAPTLQGYHRASEAESLAMGVNYSAKRFVKNRTSLKTLKREGKSASLSMRQAVQMAEQKRSGGVKKSREKIAKELKRGERQYRSESAKATSEYLRAYHKIKSLVDGVTNYDIRFIYDYNRNGRYNGLSEDGKLYFQDLFRRYTRQQVLEALYYDAPGTFRDTHARKAA